MQTTVPKTASRNDCENCKETRARNERWEGMGREGKGARNEEEAKGRIRATSKQARRTVIGAIVEGQKCDHLVCVSLPVLFQIAGFPLVQKRHIFTRPHANETLANRSVLCFFGPSGMEGR